MPVDGGQHLDALADPFNNRCPDEHSVKGPVQARDVQVGLEGVDLAAVAVATDVEVNGSQGHLILAAVEDPGGQQDHAGTGAQYRQTIGQALPDGVGQPRPFEQHGGGRGLTAWNDEGVDAGQRLGGADLDRGGPQPGEDRSMAGERPLQGQDANLHVVPA